MAIKIIGAVSGVEADVDTDRSLFVQARPPAVGALGAYSLAMSSGAIAATLGAASTLFSARWTDATRLALIKSIRVNAVVSGVVTTGVLFDLEAIVARVFSAVDSGGTAATISGNNNKVRTSMGTSLFGDIRIASTAGLTAGTRTPDAQALARIQGFTGTTAGTQVFPSSGGSILLLDRRDPGAHPIILAQNEGILIRNPLAGPATGTITLAVQMEWLEVASY